MQNDAAGNVFAQVFTARGGGCYRFANPDRVLGSASTPASMNRWAYCCNDPINRMDNTGTWGFSSIVNSVCNVAGSVVDSAVDLLGDVVEAAVDVVVEVAAAAFEVINAAIDIAEKLMEEAINACVELAEVAYDACAAVKEAWDNMDAGLKQWIVMGVSIAVSFIPVVGPLISCIVDGTFVDMLTAISSGDWAMLAMCAMAFVPGAKVMKGLKAVGGIGDLAKLGKKAPKIGVGSAKKRVAVIGESQKRVEKYAAKHGGETMPNLPPGNRMAQNRAWINSKMDEGYIIVDVGLDVDKPMRGKYYAMELHEILVSRNYERYYPVLP